MSEKTIPEGASVLEIEDGSDFISMVAEHYADEFDEDDDVCSSLIEAEELVQAGGTVCIIIKGVAK